MTQIYVLHPHEEDEVVPFERAAPLDSLEGIHVGLLGNTKPNAARLLRLLGDLLIERHGIASVEFAEKASSGRTVDEQTVARLKQQAHAIITGIGD